MKNGKEELEIGNKVKCSYMGNICCGDIIKINTILIGSTEHTMIVINAPELKFPIIVNTTLFPKNIKRILGT